MDHPHNIIIEEKDRSDQKYARMVFDELYPEETYKEWRVVQEFAIAKIGYSGICDSKD